MHQIIVTITKIFIIIYKLLTIITDTKTDILFRKLECYQRFSS